MKAKIVQVDGMSKTELEGSAEELATFFRLHHPLPIPPSFLPYSIQTPATIITVPAPSFCLHEYPEIWNSINPPSCKKCGAQSPPSCPGIVTF